MARYLTPAKISLLALVELYAQGAVPHDAILPVLSFLSSHLLRNDRTTISASNPARRWARAESTVSLVVSAVDFELLLAPHPAVAAAMPGSSLWDSYLVKLWSINSLHALHEFILGLVHVLTRTSAELRRMQEGGEEVPKDDGTRLTPSSLLGTFVCKAQAEFMKLHFDDRADLWKRFVRYRQPTALYIRRRNPAFSRLSFDGVLHQGGQDQWDGEGVASLASVAYGDMLTADLGSTLPVSTDDIENLLEFQVNQMQKFGIRVPIEIQNQFHDLLGDNAVVPSLTHYLRFLESWRGGDYITSFEHLHRFFDFTMQKKNRILYQYALMNLAVLQADFGCYREAVTAILETISTARENKDMMCLNFALNWLFHFGRAHPDLVKDFEANGTIGTRQETLAFLRVKTKELGMSTLRSSVLLTEAKVTLGHGDSVATALEIAVRSSQLIVTRNMRSMFAQQFGLYIALWDRLALPTLATILGDVFLRCHSRHTVFHEELRMTCRLAFLLAEQGKYDEALRKLDGLDREHLKAWKIKQHWNKCVGIIKLKQDLHHNNLDGADRLLSQLLQNKMDDMEPELSTVVDGLHLDALMRRREFEKAFNKVEDLLKTQRDEKRDIAVRVTLLLAKASLYSKLMTLLWHAMGAVANILISLDEFEAAARLLSATLPRSLECDSSALNAQLYSSLGDAHMGTAGRSPRGSVRRTECMTRALAAVDRAFDHYSSLGDVEGQCEMLAKKAMIMKISGEKELAADYAGAYATLRRDIQQRASRNWTSV